MLPTKLTLSEEERILMMDSRFILTKNAVLKKIELLLGVLSESLRKQAIVMELHVLPAFVLSPKIARGEQYHGLPWLMLDYPRIFTKTASCAIRCFFWWGNYWTVTLQLSGSYLEQYKQQVEFFVRAHSGENNWYLSVGENQWQHELTSANYIAKELADETYWMQERSFLKLVKKIPLEQWDNIFPLLENTSISLLSILQINQAPSR